MSVKKRKYLETYVKFRFTFTINYCLDILVCVLCQKSLGNDSMKSKSSQLANGESSSAIQFKNSKTKDLDFFKHRKLVFKKQRLDKGMFFQPTNVSLKASS